MPGWLMTLLTSVCVAVLKEIAAQSKTQLQEAADRKALDTARGIRDEKNAIAYEKAKTRAEQIKASVDLINRNN